MLQSLDSIHRSLQQAGEGLTSDRLTVVPEGESYSIALITRHAARMEALIVQLVLRGHAQIWDTGDWASHLALPAKGLGAG